MNDSRSNNTPRDKSWLDKITLLFNSEPRTRKDVEDVLAIAAENEVIDQDACSIIERAMQVSDMQARDIMIPRSQMVLIKAECTLEEILPLIISSAHSRYPVIGDSPDDVLGILLAKDLLRQPEAENNDTRPWATLLRPAVFIPESKRLNVLLQEFRDSRNHMAIVVNEYGSVVGLITIEDVLEQIVGNIEDEHDIDGAAGMVLRHGSDFCVVKAMLPVESFNQLFDVDLDPLEFDTMGGLVTSAFGHVPRRGETIEFGEFVAEVLRADSRRPRLLRITRQTSSE